MSSYVEQKAKKSAAAVGDGNAVLARAIVSEAVRRGVVEFCICPGARNSPLFDELMSRDQLKKYFWFEERSAAFFALGRSRKMQRPVAVVTTSGTAAGELLPAAMEGHYTGVPLLMITADRPRRFRGTGAPQAAEQVGLFGVYAKAAIDVAEGEGIDLDSWDLGGPAHLNVCFEEPFPKVKEPVELFLNRAGKAGNEFPKHAEAGFLHQFLQQVKYPFVVVGGLDAQDRDAVAAFLVTLNAPVFLEGISGLREDVRLRHLRITRTENLWLTAMQADYPIDGVLRIGGVPTFRFWRDLEEKQGVIRVCSISDLPFSGLSWGSVICASLRELLGAYLEKRFDSSLSHSWRVADRQFHQHLLDLFHEEAAAEPSLFHFLSKRIPAKANIYLGNSLPIREWDMAAHDKDRGFRVTASRGLNGIDGQISTFLGSSTSGEENWAILGDLTTLYDLAGPWILPQLSGTSIQLVVINNSGGQIFARMCPQKEFLHTHNLNFEPMAKMWGLHYERWTSIPSKIESRGSSLIEIVPDLHATNRFWQRFAEL